MNEDIESKLRAGISFCCGSEHLAHVAGHTGDAEQARLVIEDIVEIFRFNVASADQVRQNARIDRSRARSHHQSFERGKTHSCINTLAAVDGSE